MPPSLLCWLLARWDDWASARSRLKRLPPRLLAHLDESGSVLDVGSFDGRIAQLLKRARPDLEITGVDVVVPQRTCLPVLRYDGIRLPFRDDSWDTVLLVDVLHHDEQPERLLREALRVARESVVVKDHYWISGWDRLLLVLSDYLGNRRHGIALPYAFLRIEEWQALFEALGVRVVAVETFRYGALDRCRQVIFRLAG